MKYALTGLIAILTACTTTGNTQAPLVLQDGYVAEFVTGDCAKIDPESPWAEASDGTPVKIIYLDRKYLGYITYMDHPRINAPSVHGFDIRGFDLNWIKVSCVEEEHEIELGRVINSVQITGVN